MNGLIAAQNRLFASQPEDVVEFKHGHNGLRTQKKAARADGTVKNHGLHPERQAGDTSGQGKR